MVHPAANMMNRRWAGKLCQAALLACLLVVPNVGCTSAPFILASYLIGGPPSIEPDFDAKTHISLSEKERKVLVLCYAPTEVKWDFDAIDRELARHVSHRLAQNKIIVSDPEVVNAWLDQNSDWDRPSEVGAAFDVDYVIFIELASYSLYEENSSNLFRGRCDAVVSVYEMDGNDGHKIFEKELPSRYPVHSPVSTTEKSVYDFKRMYMSRLSEEIGWMFYEHYSGDNVPHGGLSS